MDFITKPSMVSDTKMRYCRIRNKHGGASTIQMHTLQRASDIHKFKDSRFSGIYMVEADSWDSEDVFLQLIAQLRIPHIPHAKRQIILDCNPPKNGTGHWIYSRFIKTKSNQRPCDVNPDYMEVGFEMDDNPFIPPEEKEEIRTSNEHDPVELARNFYGKWVNSSKGTAFEHQYNRAVHVIGDTSSPDKSKHTILIPPRGAFEFPTGWDLGEAMNHAIVIGNRTRSADGRVYINLIDEFVHTRMNYSNSSVAAKFMAKAAWWTEVMRRRDSPELQWRFWSDSSSLRYSAATGSTTAIDLANLTDGFIRLQGVQKRSGSVAGRLEMLKKYLYSGQLLVSANCPHVIDLLENLVLDSSGEIDPQDPRKHIFDAVTYLLTHETPTFQFKKPTESRIISVTW